LGDVVAKKGGGRVLVDICSASDCKSVFIVDVTILRDPGFRAKGRRRRERKKGKKEEDEAQAPSAVLFVPFNISVMPDTGVEGKGVAEMRGEEKENERLCSLLSPDVKAQRGRTSGRRTTRGRRYRGEKKRGKKEDSVTLAPLFLPASLVFVTSFGEVDVCEKQGVCKSARQGRGRGDRKVAVF